LVINLLSFRPPLITTALGNLRLGKITADNHWNVLDSENNVTNKTFENFQVLNFGENFST
jgi:hypothetical protein